MSSNKSKRVLVTGGAGYIGSRVCAHLLELGYQVVVYDKLIFGGEGTLMFLDHPHYTFIQGDIRDLDTLKKAMSGVDAVVHLAALVGDKACSVDQSMTWSINRDGVAGVVKTAESVKVSRLLFSSTCSNYGVSDPTVVADENSPLRPVSVYAESKVQAELAVLQRTSAMCRTVFRFGTICGLSPRMRFDLLINEVARASAEGKGIDIFSPAAWRPFLHIADAAGAVAHWLAQPEKKVNNQVFNVVTENFQKYDLIKLVQKHYPEIKISTKDGKVDPRDYRVTAAKIARELGYQPKYTIESAYLQMARAVAAGAFTNLEAKVYLSVPDLKEIQYGENSISLQKLVA